MCCLFVHVWFRKKRNTTDELKSGRWSLMIPIYPYKVRWCEKNPLIINRLLVGVVTVVFLYWLRSCGSCGRGIWFFFSGAGLRAPGDTGRLFYFPFPDFGTGRNGRREKRKSATGSGIGATNHWWGDFRVDGGRSWLDIESPYHRSRYVRNPARNRGSYLRAQQKLWNRNKKAFKIRKGHSIPVRPWRNSSCKNRINGQETKVAQRDADFPSTSSCGVRCTK